jgi:hypothetical protein
MLILSSLRGQVSRRAYYNFSKVNGVREKVDRLKRIGGYFTKKMDEATHALKEWKNIRVKNKSKRSGEKVSVWVESRLLEKAVNRMGDFWKSRANQLDVNTVKILDHLRIDTKKLSNLKKGFK